MKLTTRLTLASFLILLASPAWGQQSYVPLKEGDYLTEQAPAPKIKDAIISGSYRHTYEGKRNGTIGGRKGSGKMVYQLEIGFRSQVQDRVSINATFANISNLSSAPAGRYASDYPLEEWDASTDNGLNLIVKEAFLEYNHNPAAVFRLGRQKFNVGGHLGLIYKGIASGFSQTCRVGTWCTYIGSAKLGKGSGDNLTFAQLTYPVYETGLEIKDRFTNKIRQEQGLYIELFRNFYQGTHVPLATFGGRTSAGYAAQATDTAGNPIFFDNVKTEYFGLNGSWYLPHSQFFINYIAHSGDRDYWSGVKNRRFIGRQHVTGHLWYLRTNVNWTPELRLGLDGFTATGNSPTNTKARWKKGSTEYQEIQKGYFGEALIYFQGLQQTGESHRVGNLTFQKAHISYKDNNLPWKFTMNLYRFHKTQATLNKNNNLVSSIGREVDLLYTHELEPNMNSTLGYAIFSPDQAYSSSDLTLATGGKSFSSISVQLYYFF